MDHCGDTTRPGMLFFEDLLFTDKNDAAVLGVSRPLKAWSHLSDAPNDVTALDTPKTVASFLSAIGKADKKGMTYHVVSPRWAMLFVEVLPFIDKKRCGIVMCVYAFIKVLTHLTTLRRVFVKR